MAGVRDVYGACDLGYFRHDFRHDDHPRPGPNRTGLGVSAVRNSDPHRFRRHDYFRRWILSRIFRITDSEVGERCEKNLVDPGDGNHVGSMQ